MDIAAAKKRGEAATKGPWKRQGYTVLTEANIVVVNATPHNATFIAHARTDLPAALEALDEAQGKLEAIRSLRYELAGGAGDLSWFAKNLDRILRGSKEDAPELTNC